MQARDRRPSVARAGRPILRTHVVPGGRAVTNFRPSEFPELYRAFSGYLHEDFPEEYGTPLAALRAFQREANAAERQRFLQEVRRLAAATAGLDLQELRGVLTHLGARWTPPSRKAVVALLTHLLDEEAEDKPD